MVNMGPKPVPVRDKVRLSSAEVKKISGHFDLDTIEKLIVEGKKIDGLTILEECHKLTWLDLSESTTTDWQLVARAKLLETLLVNRCGITHINWTGALKGLKKLSLLHNNIDSLDKLEVLGQLTCLEELHLQKMDGSEANSVCKDPAYTAFIQRTCPNLRILDGQYLSMVNRKLHKATMEVEELLNVERPTDGVEAQHKSWFTKEQLEWQLLVEESAGLEEAAAAAAAQVRGDNEENIKGRQRAVIPERVLTMEEAQAMFEESLAECKKLNTIALGLNAKLAMLADQ